MYSEEYEQLIKNLNTVSEVAKTSQKNFERLNTTLIEISQPLRQIQNKLETDKSYLAIFNELQVALEKNKVGINNITELAKFLTDLTNNISQLYETTMISNIRKGMANSNYLAYIDIVNEALKNARVSSNDFAFLSLMDQYREGLVLPKKMPGALKQINGPFAHQLAKYVGIEYDTEESRFVLEDDADVFTKPLEMRVLLSGDVLFDKLLDQEEYITTPELMSFSASLQNGISFAGETVVGQKIMEVVKNIIPRITFDSDTYYHCRIWEDNRHVPFEEDEMWEAPFGYANPGRYNWCGIGCFYFANTEDGAIKEVRKHNKNGIFQVATIVPIKPVKMIDLSCDIKMCRAFLNHLRNEADDKPTPNEYLVPCYVADCCKKAHIGGIKYYGSKNYNNYVTWEHSYFKMESMRCF